ncbi:MAG TPA: hypothetical protein EYP59_02520 [Thiotrichaceae bacterium]|nr:hypothetical protein [Thiotrichaceae bacterium]
MSLLHWAVSNDGASNPKQVVWKTWQHFANRNLTTWSGRKLFYYPHHIPGELQDAKNLSEACLIHQSGYHECTEIAELLSQSLLVNNVPHKLVGIELDNKGRMMVNNWAVKKVSFPGEDYPLKLTLFKHTDTTILGRMTSPTIKRPRMRYGDLINEGGLAGQNVANPAEKIFESHQMVYILNEHLPSELVDKSGSKTPYLDPSYGVVYKDKEDFVQNALFGYVQYDEEPEAKVDDEGHSILLFKAKEAKASDNLILFSHSPIN